MYHLHKRMSKDHWMNHSNAGSTWASNCVLLHSTDWANADGARHWDWGKDPQFQKSELSDFSTLLFHRNYWKLTFIKILPSAFVGSVEVGQPDREGGVEEVALLPLHRAQERCPRVLPDHRQEPLLSLLLHRPCGQGLCHTRGGFQLAPTQLPLHPLHGHHGSLHPPPHDHKLPCRGELPSKHPAGQGHYIFLERKIAHLICRYVWNFPWTMIWNQPRRWSMIMANMISVIDIWLSVLIHYHSDNR